MKLAKLREEFAGAVSEDNFYRIGNIFYFLKSKRSFIKIHYAEHEYRGRIMRVDDDRITILCPKFSESGERRAMITFEALNRYYSTEILLLRTEGDRLQIQFPQELKHLYRRLYQRVSFDDLFMRFIILYSAIFVSVTEERNLENKYPYFFQEIKEDNPSLRVLYQMLMSEIKQITPQFAIFLFRDRDPATFSLIEKMVYYKKASILVEDTSRLTSYFEKPERKGVYNFSEYFNDLESKHGKQYAEEFFEKIQKEDLRNFIQSYFVTPVTLFEKPIGYLRMETNIFDKFGVSPIQAEEINRLLEIFSYALTKIRIRNSHFDPSSVRTQVVNISMSGLLMEITDRFLFEYLKKNQRIKMLIPIMGEELEIYGEINRFFEQEGMYYMGVLFFKTRPGDMVKLEDFLYENSQYQFF